MNMAKHLEFVTFVTLARFFFPMNLNDAHWVAGLVNLRLKHISIFDSMPGNSHSKHRQLLLQVIL
jgi:Ulp1 family protease